MTATQVPASQAPMRKKLSEKAVTKFPVKPSPSSLTDTVLPCLVRTRGLINQNHRDRNVQFQKKQKNLQGLRNKNTLTFELTQLNDEADSDRNV